MTESTLDFEKVELVRERMLLSIKDMCKLFGVSRATYYKWVGGGPIRRSNEKRVKSVLRRVLPLLKENKWPVMGAQQLAGEERLEALLELLTETE